MVMIQFVSPYHDEIDVVALGLSFTRDQIREVTDEDAKLLLRSTAFARVDDGLQVKPSSTSADAKPPAPVSATSAAIATPPKIDPPDAAAEPRA